MYGRYRLAALAALLLGIAAAWSLRAQAPAASQVILLPSIMRQGIAVPPADAAIIEAFLLVVLP